MAKPRSNNEFTTISVRWVDKDRLRGLARLVKKTKNGELYESDAVVFNRLIANHPNIIPHNTYPSLSDDQLNSCHEGPKQS